MHIICVFVRLLFCFFFFFATSIWDVLRSTFRGMGWGFGGTRQPTTAMLETEPLPHRQPETRTTRQGAPLRAAANSKWESRKLSFFYFSQADSHTHTQTHTLRGEEKIFIALHLFSFPPQRHLVWHSFSIFRQEKRAENGRKMNSGVTRSQWCPLHFAILFKGAKKFCACSLFKKKAKN